MYVHILDVHSKVLKRFCCNDLSEPYELPGYSCLADFSVEQEMMHFHQPVHFLVINNPASFLQDFTHVMIPITAELLLELSLHAFYHLHVVKDLTVDVGCYERWFTAPFTFSTLVIISAPGNSRPLQQVTYANLWMVTVLADYLDRF